MVAGSNHLLTFLDTKKENRVRVLVRPSGKPHVELMREGYFECKNGFPVCYVVPLTR